MRFKRTCSFHQITSRQRTSVRQTTFQSSVWNNWNIIDVAEQMFCPHDTLHSQSIHSYSLNAFMQDSKPQQNLVVYHWTNYRYSKKPWKTLQSLLLLQPCVCTCSQPVAVTHMEQMFNWFTSVWESVISYLCLIRRWLCALGFPPLSFPYVLISSPGFSCYLPSFCLQQHLLHEKKNPSPIQGCCCNVKAR